MEAAHLCARLVDAGEENGHNQDQNPEPRSKRNGAIRAREFTDKVANDILVLDAVSYFPSRGEAWHILRTSRPPFGQRYPPIPPIQTIRDAMEAETGQP